MSDFEDLPPVKDFGPKASLRRRRTWGFGLIFVVLSFLGVVTFILGDGTNCSDGCISFGNSNNDEPPIWLFMIGVGVVLVVSIFAPVLADKLPKIEEKE